MTNQQKAKELLKVICKSEALNRWGNVEIEDR